MRGNFTVACHTVTECEVDPIVVCVRCRDVCIISSPKVSDYAFVCVPTVSPGLLRVVRPGFRLALPNRVLSIWTLTCYINHLAILLDAKLNILLGGGAKLLTGITVILGSFKDMPRLRPCSVKRLVL